MLIKIMQIPKEIKMCVLETYISKCREQYNIAFFQWRRLTQSRFVIELQAVKIIQAKLN